MTDAEARRALAAAVKGLPQEVLRRLVGYLDCHSPPGRAMAWAKTARVIDELVALIEPGAVKRGQGAPRAAPGWLWATALDEVAAMRDEGDLTLPLKGHGLLEEICYRLAGKAEGKREAEGIARARGETPVGYHPSHHRVIPGHDAPAPASPAERVAPKPVSLKELVREAQRKTQHPPVTTNQDPGNEH